MKKTALLIIMLLIISTAGAADEKNYDEIIKDFSESMEDDKYYSGIKYNLEDAYAIIPLENLIVTEYEKGKTLEEMRSSEYSEKTIVPFINSEGMNGVITIEENNGKPEVIGMAVSQDKKDIVIYSTKLRDEIIKEKITSPVKSINNYYSYLYYATLVYVKTEDGNYVIPFFERPDTAVNNGKIFEEKEFFDVLKGYSTEEMMVSHPDENGAGTIADKKVGIAAEKEVVKKSSGTKVVFLTIVFSVMFVFDIVAISVWHRKKGNQ